MSLQSAHECLRLADPAKSDEYLHRVRGRALRPCQVELCGVCKKRPGELRLPEGQLEEPKRPATRFTEEAKVNGLAVGDALAGKLAGLLRIAAERCKLGPPDARHALAEAISAVEGELRRLVEKSLRTPPVTRRQLPRLQEVRGRGRARAPCCSSPRAPR